MSSYWGLPTIVDDSSLLHSNQHYEVLFFEERLSSAFAVEEEGEIDDTASVVSDEGADNRPQDKPSIISSSAILVNVIPQTSTVQPIKPKQIVDAKPPVDDDEEEEGAISTDNESSDASDSESDTELKRRTKAEAEVREQIMAKGMKKPLSESAVKNEMIEHVDRTASEIPGKKGEKRKADDLPQMKTEPLGAKKPAKQLRCYSEKDVDYRAIWKEQMDASKAPSNHPFFQLSVRNVRTKAYCDLWESEEKKDYLYFKPGTWDHVKDVPRLTEDNLSKLSIAEAKQFVSWLLAERKAGNSELLSLRRRFWAESDRHRRLKSYISGQRKAPTNVSAQKTSDGPSNPTVINTEGLLIVAPKEQKRLLQSYSKLWMSEETSDLLKQKQRLYTKMKRRGTEYFKNKFKEINRQCRAEVKKAKQQWEVYMMDCIRQNGIVVGGILEDVVERVATGNIPPDPRVLMAQQRRFWQSQRGGPSWAQRGRGGFRGKPQRGKSRADELQL